MFHYTLTKDPKQLFFWERFGGLQVRGATRFGGLQVRGATRLRTTDFGSAGARTSSGGYKIRGATRLRTTDFGSAGAPTGSRRLIKDPST